MTKLFGTNGIRGIVNEEMTIDVASHIGLAWGTYLFSKHRQPHVVIGTDARLSNIMLKNSITAGLLATGCLITDIGVLPTPAIQYMVKTNNFDSGVVITASHNPPEFNGIKGIDADGTEFSKQTEEAIETLYFQRKYSYKKWDQIKRIETKTDAGEQYKKAIIEQVDKTHIKSKKFHVVLDCGNGAGSLITPDLLSLLGCKVTCLYCKPDGHFPGHPSEPIPENLEHLMKTVKTTDADFGVAQDGDADRAIFIDEKGNYVWGDQTLTLMADYFTKKHGGGIVVTPVTSSSSVEEVVKNNNGRLIRTKVGSPVVAREMIKTKAIFGGEENGGLIFPTLQYCRDSAMSIAKILEVLSVKEQSLSSLLKDLPHFEMVKTKLNCPKQYKNAVLIDIINQVQQNSSVLQTNTTDGIKIYLKNGWALLRPSGTEPKFRIYSEAKTKKDAKEIANIYVKKVKESVQKVSA